MTKILSNKEYVENKIDAIKNSITPLNKDFNMNQDVETNILGNIKLHKLNDDFNCCIKQLAGFLERDLDNVKNIAKNFEVLDNSISNKIIK